MIAQGAEYPVLRSQTLHILGMQYFQGQVLVYALPSKLFEHPLKQKAHTFW